MARTLKNFIIEANSVFPGNFIYEQYQLAASNSRPVELLAQYLVAEIQDLYGYESSDHQNLARLITNLDFASTRLAEVTYYLRSLDQKTLS